MPRFLWFVIIFCVLALLCVWVYLVCPRLGSRPALKKIRLHDYAHRGLHCAEKNIYENTLSAFRAAVKNGFGIELDVRLTKDGVPVVFHDATLRRLFGRAERVCSMTYAALCKAVFPGGDRIPLLSEVLDEVVGRVPLLVELKTENDVPRLCTAVSRLLDDYGGDYCVESFDPRALRWFRKNRPEVIRGQLLTKFKKEDAALPKPLFLAAENLLSGFISRPDFISYDWLYRGNVSLRLAKKLFRFLEFNWTVSDMKTYLKLKKDGVLCIFENFNPRYRT